MRKWLILISIVILGGIEYATWLEQKKSNVILNVLEHHSFIDALTVKDGKTKEEIVTLTDSTPSFSKIVEVYQLPYTDLKLTERKILKKEPFVEVNYKIKNDVKYQVRIYKVNEKDQSILASIDQRNATDHHQFSYIYYPEDEKVGYVFSIQGNHQLLGVNEGLKELLDGIISKSDDHK